MDSLPQMNLTIFLDHFRASLAPSYLDMWPWMERGIANGPIQKDTDLREPVCKRTPLMELNHIPTSAADGQSLTFPPTR